MAKPTPVPKAIKQAMGAPLRPDKNGVTQTDEELGILDMKYELTNDDLSKKEIISIIDRHLTRFKMKTEIDKFKVRALIDAVLIYQEAMADVQENGLTYMAGEQLRTNPSVNIAEKQLKTINTMTADFFMTPSTRQSLTGGDTKVDAVKSFLNRKK